MTDGYTVTGSTLTLDAPTIRVDSGATATINSTIAGSHGLIKNGAGTLNLTGTASYTGNTTINEGVLGITSALLGAAPGSPAPNIYIDNGATLRFNANNLAFSVNRQFVMGPDGGMIDTNGNNGAIAGTLSGGTLTKIGAGTLVLGNANSQSNTVVNGGSLQVSSDANFGAEPGSFTAGNITLDGGTLQFGANFDLSNNRGITLGAGGGTIDTQGFSNPTGYNAFHGGFQGPGDLMKLGSGTFFAAATTGGANNSWIGRLIIKEGIWKTVASDGLPYNVPLSDGLQPGQVTLDGGTWQVGASMNVTNGRRGITVDAGGGTIDTQAFTLGWIGPLAGSDTSAVLTKIGSGTLQFNTNSVPAPPTYAGHLNVAEGSLVLNGGNAMGDLASIELANSAGVSLTIGGGSETIGSLAGGGAAGGNVTFSGSGLITGSNNSSTTFSGVISGVGGLTKTGSGVFALAPPSGGNTYVSGTTVSAGTLLVNNTSGSGTGSGPVTVNSGGTLGGTGSIAGAVAINSGGHIAPGMSIESLGVGSLSLAAGSILDFELDTMLGVDTSDLINVTTTNGLTINGGTLNLVNAGNMTGGFYTLIDYSGGLSGSLSNISLGSVPAGFSYRLFNDASSQSIELEVTAPGDFNHDGTVNAADYVVFRKGVGTTYSPTDYDAWRAHFGQSYTSGAGAGATLAAVPEPGTALLLVVGGAMVIASLRGRRRARDSAA